MKPTVWREGVDGEDVDGDEMAKGSVASRRRTTILAREGKFMWTALEDVRTYYREPWCIEMLAGIRILIEKFKKEPDKDAGQQSPQKSQFGFYAGCQ
jgi:hypothetical protein